MVSAGETAEAGRIPGERIATEIITTDSSTVASETEVASITAPVVTGLTYKISINGAVAGTDGDTGLIRIREDTDSGTVLQGRNVYVLDSLNVGAPFHYETEYTADATEDKTIVVTLDLTTGTGVRLEAASTRPILLYVDYNRG